MKIAQSNVNLVSSHHLTQEKSVTMKTQTMTRSAFLESLQSQEKKMDQLELSDASSQDEAISSDSYMSLKPSKSEYLTKEISSLENQIMELRNMLLERILKLLQVFGGDGQSRGYAKTLSNTANMLTDNMFVKKTTIEVAHIETEETTFSGTGTALTEDGRVIDFGVNFSMSRRLCEYAGIDVASAVSLIDPLVINVGSGVTSISDQSFFFDLDADGQEEEISNLGEGSGFLALDKNGDGKIGDGSELFGTKSGDGFKDLSAYDMDGNGWIDENDKIYDQLKIWIRNEDGTDTLLGLKEADVGAIHLGKADTEYSHFGSSFAMQAMTRASGVFLRESGGVGTVQQVDLAAL
ncbi:MAG: hypothetical protein E7305_08410 [Butyrivibrio sp.]|nr:hypothetical protein [Butyrivibrio sp.]